MGFSADPEKLLSQDLKILKPTFIPMVPPTLYRLHRIVNELFDQQTGCAGCLKQKALSSKFARVESSGKFTHACWDSLVFKRMRALLGGQQKTTLLTLGIVDKEIINYLKVNLCCEILESYGLAEASSLTCMSQKGDCRSGHAGGPITNAKIKLKDLDDLSMKVNDNPPVGEVCVQGPSVMPGYYQNPDMSSLAFHGEWLLTGDIGRLDPTSFSL